jgi:hypothetical protein
VGRWLRRLLAVLGALVVFAGGWRDVALAQASSFHIGVSRGTVTRPLPNNFLGLAVEFNTIPEWVGPVTQPANPILTQFVRNLNPVGQPLVRVGGLSTDRAWWPVKGMRQPIGITYNLDSHWMAEAKRLAQATGGKLMLGLNLQANRQRIDRVEATQMLDDIGRPYIANMEIGNEPDLYTFIPWYKVLGGRQVPWYSKTGSPVYARRVGYGPTQFAQEFARTLKVVPDIPIAGPETGSLTWMGVFRQFLSRRSKVRMLTSHAYGLNNCITDPASPQYPSVPNLLSQNASRGLLYGLGPYISLVHQEGGQYRVDEMGSISCNGRAGISDTMASALWVMDALFSMARSGIDGVNLHTFPGTVNGLFDFTDKGAWRGTVHPLYYGALMFARAAPPGSQLLHISTGSQAQVRSWATRGRDGHVRVLLINDSLQSSAQAVVQAPIGYGRKPAALERLLARSAYARSGITLGGRSFGVTSTGVLAPPKPLTVSPHDGAYAVSLPASSAALLTLTHR